MLPVEALAGLAARTNIVPTAAQMPTVAAGVEEASNRSPGCCGGCQRPCSRQTGPLCGNGCGLLCLSSPVKMQVQPLHVSGLGTFKPPREAREGRAACRGLMGDVETSAGKPDAVEGATC